MHKQRLRKEELVELIFSLFWEEAYSRGVSSIQGISIPLDRLREELAERSGAPRQNSKWIHTQVRKYEERLGVQLFEKVRDSEDNEALVVTPHLLTFVQKRHLYQAEKIRVANGVADLIERQLSVRDEPTRLYLGAGTTIAHLAAVLRDRVSESGQPLEIHTHNLGVVEALSQRGQVAELIELHVTAGRFDPVTYTLLGTGTPRLDSLDFDLVVQGTSALHRDRLYIESSDELPTKAAILRETQGAKLLALTLHEFSPEAPEGMQPYGSLQDYDFVVCPQVKRPVANQQQGLDFFASELSLFETGISAWQYRILTRRRITSVVAQNL